MLSSSVDIEHRGTGLERQVQPRLLKVFLDFNPRRWAALLKDLYQAVV